MRPSRSASSARRDPAPRRWWRRRNEATVLGVNSGASVRRCLRHSSPSTSRSPSRRPSPRTRLCRRPCDNWRRCRRGTRRIAAGSLTTAIVPRMVGPTMIGSSKCALGPGLDRILAQDPHGAERPERRIARDWRRRAQARRLSNCEIHHGIYLFSTCDGGNGEEKYIAIQAFEEKRSREPACGFARPDIEADLAAL